jgi:monoterpene epsilon-lactone hydrolase
VTPSREFTRLLEVLQSQPAQPGVSVEELRAVHEAAHASRPPIPDLVVESVDAGGVPAELVTAGAPADDGRTLVYLHGGGYVLGSLRTARGFAAELSRASGVRVLSVDYRLAPEHRYPAALEDAVAAYRHLLDLGVAPEDIALCGDSAGAGLAVATMVALRDLGLGLPAACVCFSPWTDLTMGGRSYATNAGRDPQVDREMLAEMAAAYAVDESLAAPGISPVHADLRGLPPVLVQVGSAEALLDDALAFAERAAASGVDITLRVWADMIHVWQVYAPKLPEARDAVEEVADWLNSVWDSRTLEVSS